MQRLIDGAVVSFLIDDEPFRAVGDDFGVLFVLHRPDLDGERGDERFERIEAVLEVAIRYEFRVLASDEQQIAETQRLKVPRFAHDLIDAQGGAQDFRIAGKAAVGTVVHALVGQVERREQAHRPAEMAARRLLAEPRKIFQRAAASFVKQALKPPHQRGGALEEIRKNIGKGHGGRNMKRPVLDVKGAFTSPLPCRSRRR